LGIHQPYYSPKNHTKNAWWLSTSLYRDKNVSLKNTRLVFTSHFRDENDSFKNAWWVSTSLIIRQKVQLKMPGDYPPAFLETKTTILKMPGGYPLPLLFAQKSFKKCLVGINQPF
jgi:hypothetical protein